MSKRKNSRNKSHNATSPLEKGYLDSLQSYWEGRFQTSIETLSEILVERDLDIETELALYRLWVENLAEIKDYKGLLNLKSHLIFLSGQDEHFSHSFDALAALALYELDEYEGCELLLKSLMDSLDDAYVVELYHKINNRVSPTPIRPKYISLKEDLCDYFHFVHLTSSLNSLDDKSNLSWVKKRINLFFPESPLVELLSFHQNINQEDFDEALKNAQSLHDKFPSNPVFSLYFGLSSYCQGFIEQSIDQMEKIKASAEGDSSEIHAFLGMAYGKMAIEDSDASLGKKAYEMLKKASETPFLHGKQLTFTNSFLNKLNSHFNIESKTSSKRKCWLLKVSPKSFLRIRELPLEDLNYIRQTMGNGPRKGDICFVVSEGLKGKQEKADTLRIGALFSVASDPEWHPMCRYQNILKLEQRPEVSITIDFVEGEKKNKLKVLDFSDPKTFDAFELDESALGSIEENIKFYSMDTNFLDSYKDLISS